MLGHERTYAEADWKLFRSRIAGWQEAYMERLLNEYSTLIAEDLLPHERFWQLQKRIEHDRYSPGVTIEMRRSSLALNLFSLFAEGVIEERDLEGFSEELKNSVIARARQE